jgi:hypothetical protein
MENIIMPSIITRDIFDKLLVEAPPCLRNSAEAVTFDLRMLATRRIEKVVIRPLFYFEVLPTERHELFVDGREVFVSVEPSCKDSLTYGVFSIPTGVLKSKQKNLPLTLHQIYRLILNPPGIVSLAINEIFGKESYGNN